jgi:hypothetical protein
MSILWSEVLTERRRTRSEQKQAEEYLEANGETHATDEPDTDEPNYYL